MLALLLLGSVFAWPSCNNVTSCYAQVNGTRGLHKLVGTLANGGVGYSFTTDDCMKGLIGISDTCECQNTTMWGSQSTPKFCYSSGDWAKQQSTDDHPYCSNQDGLNTFSLFNSTDYTRCKCFDPVSGNQETATLKEPVCKKGRSKYTPCVSTDGTGDNAAVLAPYTGETLKALFDISGDPSVAFPRCQCGTDECYNIPSGPHGSDVRPYCQADISSCSEYKVCPTGVFSPKDTFDQQECACGYHDNCYAGTKCETTEIDGIKRFACTLDGRSSNFELLLKQMFGAAFMVFVFSIMSLICMTCVMLFSILTCFKLCRDHPF